MNTRSDVAASAPVAVNERFSDVYAYGDLKLQFVYSCYLVKHGDEYLLWDTGHAMTMPNVAPKVSLVDLLAKIDLRGPRLVRVNDLLLDMDEDGWHCRGVDLGHRALLHRFLPQTGDYLP